MRRGEIYYIHPGMPETGSEQTAGRPAIIVSNNANNKHSATVEVVYLTTRPKIGLPTHVKITSSWRPSTAICEQITSVSVSRVGNYMGTCSRKEMAELNRAIKISLGIDYITNGGI